MLVKNIARNLAVIACCLLNEFTCICQTNFLIFFILQDYDTSHPQWEFLQMIRYVSPARYCWLVCIVWDLLIWREYCSHLDLRPLVGNESVSCTHLLNATVLKWTLPSIKGVGLPKKLLQFAIHSRIHCPETKRTTQPSFCLKRMLGINFTHCIVCGFFFR